MQNTDRYSSYCFAALTGVTFGQMLTVCAFIYMGQDVRYDLAIQAFLCAAVLVSAVARRNAISRAHASHAREGGGRGAPHCAGHTHPLPARRAGEISEADWEEQRALRDAPPTRINILPLRDVDPVAAAEALAPEMLEPPRAFNTIAAEELLDVEFAEDGVDEAKLCPPLTASHHHALTHQTAPLLFVAAMAQQMGAACDAHEGVRRLNAGPGDFARAAAAYALPAEAEQRKERMRKHGGRPAFWTLDPELWQPPADRLDELALAGALVLMEMEALIALDGAGRSDFELQGELMQLEAPVIDRAAAYLARFYPTPEDAGPGFGDELLVEIAQELDDMLGDTYSSGGDPDVSWRIIGRVWRDLMIAMGIEQATYMHREPTHWDPEPVEAEEEAGEPAPDTSQ